MRWRSVAAGSAWTVLSLVGLAACAAADDPVDASSADDPPSAGQGAGMQDAVDGERASPVVGVLASGEGWTSLASSGGSLWLGTGDGLERRDPDSGELQFTLEEDGEVIVSGCGDELLAVALGTGQARLLDVRSNRYAMDLTDEAIAAALQVDEEAVFFQRCHGPSGRAVVGAEAFVGAESPSDTSGNPERAVSIAIVEVGRDGFSNPEVVEQDERVRSRTLDSVLVMSGVESGILGAWGPEGSRAVDDAALWCPCVEHDGAVWALPAASVGEELTDRIEVAQNGLVPEPLQLGRLDGGPGELFLPVTENVLLSGDLTPYVGIGGRTFLLDRDELLEVDVATGEFLSVTALPGIDEVVDVLVDDDRVFVLAETVEGPISVYDVGLAPAEEPAGAPAE